MRDRKETERQRREGKEGGGRDEYAYEIMRACTCVRVCVQVYFVCVVCACVRVVVRMCVRVFEKERDSLRVRAFVSKSGDMDIPSVYWWTVLNQRKMQEMELNKTNE